MPVLEYDEMAKTEVDEEYIRILENKLKNLRKNSAQLSSAEVLADLKSFREDKLFNLLTKSSDQCFEDNFTGQPLTATYLQRKLAPQKIAVHSGELIALLDADQLQLQNSEESNTAAVVAADGFKQLKEGPRENSPIQIKEKVD